ncbi:unnamed protein product [Penicillium glandicola]
MRHFDTWVLRDPYSIWHYYPTGHRWRDTVRDLIQSRAICSPENNLSPPINWTNPISQESPLLRLPAELRQIIWSYVLTNSLNTQPPQTIHLVQLKGKIRHVRCPSQSQTNPPNHPTSLTQNRHCCPTTPARWRIYDGRVPGHSDRLLYPHTHSHLPSTLSNSNSALLRVCRSIYFEAEPILYKASHFDVDDLYTFIAFAMSLSSVARNAISRLTVQWMPIWVPMAGLDHKGSVYAHTHSDDLWVRFWEVVASLEGLRVLGLSLDLGRFTSVLGNTGQPVVSGQRIPFGIKEGWVRPILKVRGLEAFDMAVTARCDLLAKGVIEGELVRDVGVLREELRGILCGPRERVDVKMEDSKRRKHPCTHLRIVQSIRTQSDSLGSLATCSAGWLPRFWRGWRLSATLAHGPLQVPGFGSIPPTFELPPEARFAHGLVEYRHSPRLTKREMAMLRLMRHITEHPGWDRAILDSDETKLVQWYQDATEETEGFLISTATWNWCLAELRNKAETWQATGRLLVFDSSSAVCQADLSTTVSREEFQHRVARLGSQ